MSDLDVTTRDLTATRTLSSAELSRRGMLRGVGAATLGVASLAALAACSSDSGTGTTSTAAGTTAGTTAGATAGATADSGAGTAASLAKLSDIPVGGAISAKGADGKPIILSQPTAGTVVGMSAICTHQGCTVAPDGAELKCPCHGSVYKAADGSNVSGPAPKPLPSVAVKVVDGQVVAG